MATTTRRWLPIVVGVAVLLTCIGIGAIVVSIAWFRENADVSRNVSETRAEEAFAAARRRFPDPRPVMELDGDRHLRLVDPAAARRNPGSITTLDLLAWDPDEGTLATVTLPMWLVRLKSGPIDFGGRINGLGNGVQLEVADIERYGPGVLIDYATPSGERVLLSAQ